MVLISTENLERLQRQLQQQHPITDEALENTRNAENSESANNSVQTPKTPVSRFDAEMSQILNSLIPRDESERWKMYKDVLWRYLHFTRAARRQNQEESHNAKEKEEEKKGEGRRKCGHE